MKRDVAIIGGGPAAIYAAYEFALKYPDIKVVILEEGHAIDFRNCPIMQERPNSVSAARPAALCAALAGPAPFLTANITLRRNLAAG